MPTENALPARTSRSAVVNRAPTKILAGLGARRTSQEQHIGQLEDKIVREDLERKKAAVRPDLNEKGTTSKSQKGGNASEGKGPKLKIVIKPKVPAKPSALKSSNSDSEHDKHRSENQSASRSSYDVSADTCISNDAVTADNGEDGSQEAGSNSQPASPMQDFLGEPEDDYDREDDSDYEQDQDEGEDDEGEEEEASNEGDGNHRRKLSKPKLKKHEKGLKFWERVNGRRETSSTSAISKGVQKEIQKRKRRAFGDSGDESEEPVKQKSQSKRPKHEEPSGLLKNFHGLKAKNRAASHSQSEHMSDGDDLGEYNGGFFDQDEDNDALKVGRQGTIKGSTHGSKPETSVRIVEPAPPSLPTAITRRKFKKDVCKKANLPFPSKHANRCIEKWDRQFKSTLITWNATLRQPFLSGTLLSSEVRVVWEMVFGDLAPLEDNDECWPIVETIAGDFLLNWRSEIGKTAITVTVSLLREELKDRIKNNEGDEAGIEAAEYLLDDHRFVYGNPDAEEDLGKSAEPFQGSLVLETFTYHIRQAVYLVKGYKKGRHAIGALGLCAAAVKQALMLICEGHITIAQWPLVLLPPISEKGSAGSKGSGKRRQAAFPPFSEAAWGHQTRGWVDAAESLPREHWDNIVERATTDEIELLLSALASEDKEDLQSSSVRSKEDSHSRLRM